MRDWAQRRLGLLIATTAVALLGAAPAAQAGVFPLINPDLGGPLTAGQLNQTGTLTITNSSTPPDTLNPLNVTSIRLAPSCRDQTFPASGCGNGVAGQQELNTFSIDPNATGSDACAGFTFTVSETDPATENHLFTPTPNTPVPIPLGEDCVITFTFDVLRVPTMDVTPVVTPATVETYANARAEGEVNLTPGSDVGSDTVTVNRAAPTLVVNAASTGTVGSPIGATGTLANGSLSPAPGGQIEWSLYGPNDATCANTPLITTDTAVVNGVSSSPAFIPSAPGTYRWKAGYGADANNEPDGALCNSPGSLTEVVNAPPALVPIAAATPLAIATAPTVTKKCKKGQKLKKGKCKRKRKKG